MNNLASLYWNAGQAKKAVPLFEEALQLMRDKLGPDHPSTLLCMTNLAQGYRYAGQLDKALPLLEEALRLTRDRLGNSNPQTIATVRNLAAARQATGDLEGALPLFEEAAAAMEKSGFRLAFAGQYVHELIACHEQLEQFDRAEPWRRKWLAVVQDRDGDDSLPHAGALAALGLNLLRQEKWPEAENVVRDALAIREQREPDAWTTFNAQSMLGHALLGQKEYADAEPLLRSGYEGMIQRENTIPAQGRARLTEGLERLVQFYEATSKPEEAMKWRQELKELQKRAQDLPTGN